MGLYEELCVRKANGEEILKFEELSVGELKQLYIDEGISDRALAKLFNIKQSKVTYRRRITFRNAIFDEYLSGKPEVAKAMNVQCKKVFLLSKK